MGKKSAVIMSLLLTLALCLTPGLVLARSTNGHGNGNGHVSSANSSNSNTTGSAVGNGSSRVNTGKAAAQSKWERIKERIEKSSKTSSDYSDTSNSWAANDIKKVTSIGLFSGYPDHTFKPDQPVTSLEAVTLAVRLANLTADESDQSVQTTGDTTADSSETETGILDQAAQLKLINTNRFHSQVQANRAEAAVMLAKAMGLTPVDQADLPFTDTGYLSAEDIGYLAALSQQGIIKGTADGKFNPNSAITRAEIAAMLARIVGQMPDDGTTTTRDTLTAQ